VRKIIWFSLGVLAAIAGLLMAVSVFLWHAAGLSTRANPGALETWAARRARSMVIPTGAKNLANPLTDSPELLTEARAHWADHCALCHSNNGSGDVEIGKHMYPQAPDMRRPETQNLTDGELFYIIQNVIFHAACGI